VPAVPRRPLRRILLALLGAAALAAVPAGALGAAPDHLGAPQPVPSAGPAFNGDAPDPDVVQAGGVFYAFTTGTALGNYLQALVDTSGSPTRGWGSYTGTSYGSSALPSPPSWEQTNTQTSPGVFNYGGHWVLFYDAAQRGFAGDTGHDCLSVATAASLTPTHPVFSDTSTGPLLCQANLGGAIDPQPVVDPATGRAYLVWKSNDGGSAQPAGIWSAQLDSTGTRLASSPVELLTNDTVDHPWESTVEDPQLVPVDGQWVLLFAGGLWQSSSYAEGYALCQGPSGPCSQPQAGPFLTSSGSAQGPGAGVLFQNVIGNWQLAYAAWAPGCTSYSCGGARRLFVAPVTFGAGLDNPVATLLPSLDGKGYDLATGRGGVFSYGDAVFAGSAGALTLARPVVGAARTASGNGYWLVASDGGLFNYGDAHYYGSMGGRTLNQPVVGMAPTADGKGYWMVARDGGIFAFGDAAFHGSMGGQPLNKPVVGMAPTPDGKGYWLVASDGGIFAFGDAAFWGSTGSLHLVAPVVGMAPAPGGRGYWLVASDGGIFAFGSAPFHGSLGGTALAAPVASMAPTPDAGGYWLVGQDGAVHGFGDAPFEGAPA
jgi:hypothetical protein